MQPLLVTRWEEVLLVSWGVPDELLVPSVPAGLRLDRVHGRAMISLIAARISSPSTLGIRWPGFGPAPAVGLAFYVRDSHRRGLCLFESYLGSGPLGALARWMFRGPARKADLKFGEGGVVLARDGREHRVGWRADGELVHPGRDSVEHLLIERRFVFLATGPGKTRMVRFEHPIWRVRERVEPRLDVDFGALWGQPWAFLADEVPANVALAEGSEVAFYPARVWDGGADDRRIPVMG